MLKIIITLIFINTIVFAITDYEKFSYSELVKMEKTIPIKDKEIYLFYLNKTKTNQKPKQLHNHISNNLSKSLKFDKNAKQKSTVQLLMEREWHHPLGFF